MDRLIELTRGKLRIWNYAAGICAPDFDPANFTRLTGFKMREIVRSDADYFGYPKSVYYYDKSQNRHAGDFPLFTIEADGMEVLSRYSSGEVNCAKLGNDVVCSTPSLDRNDLRALAKRAGVTIVCDADCTVYADNRIAGLFPSEDYEGVVNVFGHEEFVKIPKHGYKILKKN